MNLLKCVRVTDKRLLQQQKTLRCSIRLMNNKFKPSMIQKFTEKNKELERIEKKQYRVINLFNRKHQALRKIAFNILAGNTKIYLFDLGTH